ncbi:MAG: formyltransferase family protein, partial [Acidimicrobiales bacterium]
MCVAVLASGSGTILQALVDDGVPVVLVVADRPCRALAVAEAAAIPTELVARDSFGPDFDRLAYTHRVLDVLASHPEVELVAMAGFGTVLDKPLVQVYEGRVLNTHPALLPAFPGWHAVDDALAAGVKVSGCTVHLATAEVDAGPILAQEAVAVLPGDTAATLHE